MRVLRKADDGSYRIMVNESEVGRVRSAGRRGWKAVGPKVSAPQYAATHKQAATAYCDLMNQTTLNDCEKCGCLHRTDVDCPW